MLMAAFSATVPVAALVITGASLALVTVMVSVCTSVPPLPSLAVTLTT